ncbi:MAG: outer membrane protein assembly factor BamE [Taibaiella sp.]|nr:outer membrane protein assembly factor BamE [Taibaiella sp.]
MIKIHTALLLKFGIGRHAFNKELWLNRPRTRKCFVQDIINNVITVGMSRNELIKLLGVSSRNEYNDAVLSYLISSFKNGKTKEILNVYFDEKGLVSHVRIKYRKMHSA